MIREFKFEDLDEVNKLLQQLEYKLEEKSFDNDFLKVLVYEESEIEGVLIYQDLIDIITIDYIVVNDKSRKKGIGTKLLKYIEDKYKNINNITLEVRESNINAINFYKSNGFKEVTKRKHYYKNEDGILMIKEFR